MESVMSVQPRPWPQPAPEIVAAVAVMYRGKRERPLPVVVRDQLGEWLSDEQFAGACGTRGKPGWPPGRLALVTVFQMAEDLTGRQAAEAVRTRIGWKYALGLDLADPGFDGSVLSEFRARWCQARCWRGWPLAGWCRRAGRCAPIPLMWSPRCGI
jgi:hypothetical protein